MTDLVVYILAVSAIGIGIGWKDPAWALVVVGAIVLGTIFAARLTKGEK